MSLLDRIASRLGYERRAKAREAAVAEWLRATAEGQQWSLPDYSLAENQERLFQSLSWVYSAVMTVAETAAGATLNVMRRQGEKLVDIPNHEFELRLQQPNPLHSQQEFIVATVAYRALTGNAYWWLNRGGESEPPAEIWVLPSHMVRPIPDGRMFVRGYAYDPGSGHEPIVLPKWQVVHFKKFHPLNWFVGLSPVEPLAVVAEGDMKAQVWNTNFFGKENAKVPGALAYADPINDADWGRMKEDIKRQWGGVNRSGPLLMRNVGPGGVQWIAMSISQKDMEFLASRTFTREEIYSIYAPGLASVLAVNATEANARSGKATFIEQAVWPVLVSIAQKVTSEVLPAYGPDLIAQWEDIRVTDRALELQEQQQYATCHTIDEIRERYYEDKPLGDPRGQLLPAQVGPTTPGPGMEELEPEPAPTPPQLAPFTGEQPGERVGEGAQEREQEEARELERAEAEALSEIAKWRRYALRNGAMKAATFEVRHVPADIADVIRARLQAACCAEEVKAAFSGPFLIKARRVTRDGLVDPLGDAKEAAERKLMRLLRARFDGELDAVMAELGDPPDLNRLTSAFWETQAGLMLADLRPEIETLALIAGQRLIETGIGVDWMLVAERAAAWAERYAYELVRGINERTRAVLQRQVAQYFREPTEIGALRRQLEPIFGPVRAEMIAVTEVTRAASEGERLTVAEAQAQGMRLTPIWHTNRDELVCSICAPRDGKPILDGQYPPAHPRCRCWHTHRWER